ncbi:hypothetical protein GO730_20075 [Spirosoma sp. HMF3257]|nr:hypothetical protein [Spirosoma telluris]
MDKTFKIYISSDDIRYYVFKPGEPVFLVKPKGGSFKPCPDLDPVKWDQSKKSYTLSVNAYQPDYATCQLTQTVVIKEIVGDSTAKISRTR